MTVFVVVAGRLVVVVAAVVWGCLLPQLTVTAVAAEGCSTSCLSWRGAVEPLVTCGSQAAVTWRDNDT